MCSTCVNIEFVRRRDGTPAALTFARQAVRAYRRAVRQVRGRTARPAMIAAYVAAKLAAAKMEKGS